MAKRVEMTKMPELVAFMHSMIGMSAVFIAIAAIAELEKNAVRSGLIQAVIASANRSRQMDA